METDSLFCWISINILQQLNMHFVILMIEIDSYTQFEEPIHSLWPSCCCSGKWIAVDKDCCLVAFCKKSTDCRAKRSFLLDLCAFFILQKSLHVLNNLIMSHQDNSPLLLCWFKKLTPILLILFNHPLCPIRELIHEIIYRRTLGLQPFQHAS